MQTGYLAYFGLLQPAFDPAQDSRFFYANRPHQDAFIALRYGIKLRSGVMVLTGDAGIGKSTLMRLVKDRCESTTHVGEISCCAQKPSAFLTDLPQVLGTQKTVPDRHSRLEELGAYLIEQFEHDRIVAAVVEDAHELDRESLEELESLSKFHWDHKNLLQIVLVGRPELEIKLHEWFNQRVALWRRVEALRADEIGRYINHRLACAGRSHGGLFRPGAVERIAGYSKGVPRVINIICAEALFLSYSARFDQVDAETIDRVWQTLQSTGESEFDGTALPSESRIYFAPPEVRPIHSAPRMEESGLEERIRAAKPERKSAPRKKLRESPRENALRWLDVTDRMGVLIGRARHMTFSVREVLPDQARRWRSSRWFGWSAALAMLLFIASVAMLSKGPGEDPIEKGSMEEGAATRQAVGTERPDALWPADVQPPHVREIPDASEVPQHPQELAAPPRQIGKEGINDEYSSTQTARSMDKAGAMENRSAPLVYVHTSAERDRPILEEIGNVLRDDGYDVRGTRFTRNGTQGDVRFFFPRDRDNAEQVKSLVQLELVKRGYSLSLQLLERDGKQFEHAAPGKIEVWLPPLTNAHRAS